MMSWYLRSRLLLVFRNTRPNTGTLRNFFPCRCSCHGTVRGDRHRWYSTGTAALQPLHRAAREGDLAQLDKLVNAADIDVETRDRRGWNALMHAVHGDRPAAVERLLTAGCNPAVRNYSDHSASELARFWDRSECLRLLAPAVSSPEKPRPMFFSGGPLVRASGLRTDSALMGRLRTCASARYLLSYKSGVALEESERPGRGGKTRKSYRLWYRTYHELETEGISVEKEDYVFLGFDETKKTDKNTEQASTTPKNVGEDNISVLQNYGAPVFVLPLEKSVLGRLQEDRTLVLSTNYEGLLKLSPRDAAIASQAIGMVDWLWRYRVCATCGSDTVVHEAGYKRRCQNEACTSNQRIRNTSYPRSDVSVIVAVTSPDGESILMVRPPGMYPGVFTCPSGYLEPGEVLEETCRREVFEETGLRLGNMTYQDNQFWPNPSVLMVGFRGEAKNEDIKLDTTELEQGRWFPRAEAADAMAQVHDEALTVVPPFALGHHLIKAWLLDTSRA